MNEKHMVDLHDPANAQDAATKNYVDTALTSVNPQYFATKNFVDALLILLTLKISQLRIMLKLLLVPLMLILFKMSHWLYTKFRERCK